MQHSLEILGAGLFALMGAALILLGIARWTRAPARPADRARLTAFLFDGPDLLDASPSARHVLGGRDGRTDLAALLELLARGFGSDLAQRIAALPPDGRLRLASPGFGILDAEADGTRLRLTLHADDDAPAPLDRLALDAAREELALLCGIAEAAPQPVWCLDPEGRLVWANPTYQRLAAQARERGTDHTDGSHDAALFPSPAGSGKGGGRHHREALELPGREEPSWFEVTTVARGPGTLHFATEVSALVQAESARLHFVQALTKTFAHLSTGLAIFDRERRLVLFNPAFVDLTGLPIDFLSGRPLVHSVLDRLREAEMVPEPRDYAAWREEVAALEAAAARGVYSDTWNLPGGHTYRVTGRPHPDGALALLFEDISGEVGLVRHLRSELDAARAALDALAEATAVFGATGALSVSNAAYAELWGAPPGGADLSGELARWQAACAPSTLWPRLAKGSHRTILTEDLRRLDGHDVRLRLTPLPRGAALVTFRRAPAREAASVALGAFDGSFPSPTRSGGDGSPRAALMALEEL